jgi:subtilase family serine protease
MTQVRSIYQIPTPNVSKYVIGVMSFGGGLYGTVDSQGVLTNGDVQAYWTSIGIAPANHPKVIVVGVNGGSNRPSMNDGSATIENTLDVETVGGACPSANVTIILYIDYILYEY